MPELPYQTWARLMGSNWPPLSQLAVLYQQAGINAPAGSAAGNVALQNKLLSGWRPGAAAPAPAPPAPAPPAAPAATPTPSGLGVPVQPGIFQQMEQERIALEKYIADLQNQLSRATEARQSRAQEAQLAANPADFVAYELYKRALQSEGQTPTTGAARSDTEIQNLFSTILGLPNALSAEQPAEPGTVLGRGQFGVGVPTTGSISRQQLSGYSPTDLGILTSFLRGGVKTDGKYAGIDPEGYFRDLQQGLVPTLVGTGMSRYQY